MKRLMRLWGNIRRSKKMEQPKFQMQVRVEIRSTDSQYRILGYEGLSFTNDIKLKDIEFDTATKIMKRFNELTLQIEKENS